MADLKISQLTAITTLTPATDVLPVVDVTGTTKKITTNQILGSGGTATLASATITGDLTVDTSTLKVDSTNNRVGIGTASPTVPLEIRASDNSVLTTGGSANFTQFKAQVDSGVGTSIGSYQNVFGYVGTSSNHYLEIRANNIAQQKIEPLGVFTWYDGAGGTRMTLNATGLGVGQSVIGAKVDARDTSSVIGFRYIESTTGNSNRVQLGAGAGFGYIDATASAGSPALQLRAAGNIAATIDGSGSLSVGATSALNSVRIFAERASGSVAGFNRTTSDGTNVLFYRQSLIVGDVSVTTTGTTFNSTSDYRLKESVQPLVGGLARVNALKPSIYKWKLNGSSGEGFLAHELAEVVPASVTGVKDAVNEDGSIKAQSIDMSRIVPILVAAIKELTARVQTLEAK